MTPEEKNRIKNIIADIMVNDGPDGHCDGDDIIADFIEAYMDGREDEWVKNYFTESKPRLFSSHIS